MFVSDEEVVSLTGYSVTPEEITYAQTIIETYVGRTEADVEDPRDFATLARAVAFQAVYMKENANIVYEQVDARTVVVGGASYTFRENTAAPFIAPQAVLACKNLSWKRARGVKTGRISPPQAELLSWWTED